MFVGRLHSSMKNKTKVYLYRAICIPFSLYLVLIVECVIYRSRLLKWGKEGKRRQSGSLLLEKEGGRRGGRVLNGAGADKGGVEDVVGPLAVQGVEGGLRLRPRPPFLKRRGEKGIPRLYSSWAFDKKIARPTIPGPTFHELKIHGFTTKSPLWVVLQWAGNRRMIINTVRPPFVTFNSLFLGLGLDLQSNNQYGN